MAPRDTSDGAAAGATRVPSRPAPEAYGPGGNSCRRRREDFVFTPMNGRTSFACLLFALLSDCGGAATSLPSGRDASLDSGGRDGAATEAAGLDATIVEASNADDVASGGDAGSGGDGASFGDGAAFDATARDGAIDGATIAVAGDAAAADGTIVDASGATPPPDAAAHDGGGTSTPVPGRLTCGTGTCNVTLGEFCCVQAGGAASCTASSGACDARVGAPRECEKASDCLGGDVCCYDFSSFPASASCRGDCGGGGGTRVQACRAQAECAAGTCAVHACADAGSIESCEPHTPECP